MYNQVCRFHCGKPLNIQCSVPVFVLQCIMAQGFCNEAADNTLLFIFINSMSKILVFFHTLVWDGDRMENHLDQRPILKCPTECQTNIIYWSLHSLKQHYVEVNFLCNTTVVHTNPMSVTIWQALCRC